MIQFTLNPDSGVPIYRQIQDQVRCAIAAGMLRPGEQLPTVRALAVELSVNPNTVIKAYSELEREGVLSSEQGSGTFVAPRPPRAGEAQRAAKLETECTEFLARAAALGFAPRDVARALNDLVKQRWSP